MKLVGIVIFGLVAGLVLQKQALARNFSVDDPIVIGAVEGSRVSLISAHILAEAYKRINVPMRFRFLPAKRALIEANAGNVDGDAGRIEGTEYTYTNLLPVKIPVTKFIGQAFSDQNITGIESWQDLRPYRVGSQRGIRYSTNALKDMNPTLANTPRELMVLLLRGQVDIIVTSAVSGEVTLRNYFPDSGIKPVGKPLHQANLYHLLRREHQSLIPKLEHVLQQMQDQGEDQKIREWVIRQMHTPAPDQEVIAQ